MSGLDEESREAARMRTSTRDTAELRGRIEAWLRDRVDARAAVSGLSTPETNGLSSETLLFDASWDGRTVACVARMAPSADAVPVFPDYDLGRQVEVMRVARERAGVPAPRVLWFEPDPGPLGTPFFVMERASGLVPPDVMPYTFEGWLLDAAPADRARLRDRTVEILARLHRVGPAQVPSVAAAGRGLRRHVDGQRAYYEWAHADLRIPLLERAFGWLEDHWPADPGPDVLNWGDARIGNVMYADFEPVAVLDWEMAAVAPPEVDLGWMIFLHRFFQDVTEVMGLPGLPDFMTRADVCRVYRELSGHEPRDMDFYETYAALRHGVIMARVWRRRIHFGEQPMPADPDDLVMHRARLEHMISG
ncbi:phosphotransferase family protein [Microbispora corallina]|uniref:Phosphotransferase n=1 Tax=Microbispora corallina TaxID=83302 RepID=A0ABQ4FR76_9ACTN|nr:phosphotransferase family protein [Microbispora corallina]GIH37321.1 putative phosphotransferase [Microbispora corallina]